MYRVRRKEKNRLDYSINLRCEDRNVCVVCMCVYKTRGADRTTKKEQMSLKSEAVREKTNTPCPNILHPLLLLLLFLLNHPASSFHFVANFTTKKTISEEEREYNSNSNKNKEGQETTYTTKKPQHTHTHTRARICQKKVAPCA